LSPFSSRHSQPPGYGGFVFVHYLQLYDDNEHFDASHAICCIARGGVLRLMGKTGSDRMDSGAYLASQLAKGFARSLQQRAARLGFSPGQFPILLELWAEDGLTQKQLLARVDIEQATMANTLARMERDGLIDRRPHPSDKRAQLVFLTGKAKGMQGDAIEAAREADLALFEGFKTFERELTLEYIRRLLANAKKL
jgi:MarR family transcriptional regulator for hemolysin